MSSQRRLGGFALAVVCACWLVVVALPARADPTVWVHVPRHRSAEALVPVAELALGSDGSASVDGEALILVGSAAGIERARALVEARDRPARTILLTVESVSERQLRSAGYEIRWVSSESELSIGTVAGPRPGVPPVSGNVYRSARGERESVLLRVRDGETATIDLREVVPLPARGIWGGQTSVVEYPSGLTATPRLLGSGRVEVELVWAAAAVSRWGRGVLERVATTVEVAPGQAIVVSGRGSRVSTTRQARSESARLSDAQLTVVSVELASPEAEYGETHSGSKPDVDQ